MPKIPNGKPAAPRTYQGKPPDDGILIGSAQMSDCEWGLYIYTKKLDAKSRMWLGIKAVAFGRVPIKANFWLSWCATNRRYRATKDWEILQIYNRDILSWVMREIEALTPDFLDDLYAELLCGT